MSATRHQRIMKKFASKLRDARIRKYRSAQKFAEKMGLDPHRYRKYERGDAPNSPGLPSTHWIQAGDVSKTYVQATRRAGH
jgi:transcriptional regulator with XRE-family HTH domain